MSEQEDYTYPGTHVLKNKADIRDLMTLRRFERGATAVRTQELRENPVRDEYDLTHLQVIRKQVFRDIYGRTDEVREVDITGRPTDGRTLFTFKEDTPQKAQEIQSATREANYLHGMDKEQSSGRMTEVYTGMSEIHPFRRGNGHATRESVGQLTKDMSYQLDYPKVDKQAWNEVVKESVHGNLEPVHEVFCEITTVERAVAFDKLTMREAPAKRPELDGVYKMLHDAHQIERDAAYLQTEISGELHNGQLMNDSVTLDESKRIIDHAVAYRGLMIRGAERLGGRFKGRVMAVSLRHVVFQVDDMVAVRYKHTNLDRDLAVDDHVTIQCDKTRSQVYEQDKEPIRDRGGEDMQMEHGRVSTSRWLPRAEDQRGRTRTKKCLSYRSSWRCASSRPTC